jgi:uncharacterized membrane protein
MASQIVVLGFDGEETAEGMFENFMDMQKRGLIQLEDAVIASRGHTTEVRVQQTDARRGRRALAGAGIGVLAGWLVGGPIGGAAVGSIVGGMKDRGVDDGFVRELSHQLTSDSSSIFLLVQEADGPKVLEELKPFKARVLHTTLTADQERRLREGLRDER